MNSNGLFMMLVMAPFLTFLNGFIIGVTSDVESPGKAMAWGALATAAEYAWIAMCFWAA